MRDIFCRLTGTSMTAAAVGGNTLQQHDPARLVGLSAAMPGLRISEKVGTSLLHPPSGAGGLAASPHFRAGGARPEAVGAPMGRGRLFGPQSPPPRRRQCLLRTSDGLTGKATSTPRQESMQKDARP